MAECPSERASERVTRPADDPPLVSRETGPTSANPPKGSTGSCDIIPVANSTRSRARFSRTARYCLRGYIAPRVDAGKSHPEEPVENARRIQGTNKQARLRRSGRRRRMESGASKDSPPIPRRSLERARLCIFAFRGGGASRTTAKLSVYPSCRARSGRMAAAVDRIGGESGGEFGQKGRRRRESAVAGRNGRNGAVDRQQNRQRRRGAGRGGEIWAGGRKTIVGAKKLLA